MVSHDREFLDNVVTSTLVFEEGGAVHRYPGGYSDWLRKGHALAVKDGLGRAAVEEKPPPLEPRNVARPAKLSYKRKLELDALPEKIETLEKKVASLEAEAAAPDFYARPFAEVEPVLNENRFDQASARGDSREVE